MEKLILLFSESPDENEGGDGPISRVLPFYYESMDEAIKFIDEQIRHGRSDKYYRFKLGWREIIPEYVFNKQFEILTLDEWFELECLNKEKNKVLL